MTSHRTLHALAGAAGTAEVVGYLAWRPAMKRYAHVNGHTDAAATTVEPLAGPGSGRSA